MEKSEPGVAFDLNGSVNDPIGACGGDLLATIRSLDVRFRVRERRTKEGR